MQKKFFSFSIRKFFSRFDCQPVRVFLSAIINLYIIFTVKNVVRLTKCLIVGSLIYYTWAEGLWSDTEHTQCIYEKLTDPKPCK